MRGEGFTRDISPTGVYVLTGERLPSGVVVKLEVSLPSLRERRSGACLRTHGHVVRAEELGFAAAAEMGFRMQLPERRSSKEPFGWADGVKHEAAGPVTKAKFRYLVSRSYSA